MNRCPVHSARPHRALLLAFIAAIGCGHDASTRPGDPQRVTILYGYLELHTPDYASATILEAQILIDGASAGILQYQTPTSGATFYLSGVELSRGPHQVRLRIITQTVSPTLYMAETGGDRPVIVAIDYVTGVEREFSLPAKTATLASGESISLDLMLDF